MTAAVAARSGAPSDEITTTAGRRASMTFAGYGPAGER
jgi:hypothetical protein